MKHKVAVEIKKGYFGRAKGLIGETDIKPTLLHTRFGIHTFFMKESIDAIVLDKHNRITILRSSLKPSSFFFWFPFYPVVIEMSEGEIEKRGLKVGDQIEIEEIEER